MKPQICHPFADCVRSAAALGLLSTELPLWLRSCTVQQLGPVSRIFCNDCLVREPPPVLPVSQAQREAGQVHSRLEIARLAIAHSRTCSLPTCTSDESEPHQAVSAVVSSRTCDRNVAYRDGALVEAGCGSRGKTRQRYSARTQL